MLLLAATPASAQEDPKAAALESLDEFMLAFNARDPKAWAETLNYPHVRIAGDRVQVTESAEVFAASMDFSAFADRFDWDHSGWDKREVIQVGKNKVHIAVTFTRYDKNNQMNATFDSFYVVTKKDGHWGTQARSSFAP